MSANELYRRWANAIAEFDIKTAIKIAKRLERTCRNDTHPNWSYSEKKTFYDFFNDDVITITAEMRGRVMQHEITRAVKRAQQEGDEHGHSAV